MFQSWRLLKKQSAEIKMFPSLPGGQQEARLSKTWCAPPLFFIVFCGNAGVCGARSSGWSLEPSLWSWTQWGCNHLGLNHVETPWMQRDCPIFCGWGGMSCIPCQRSCLFKAGKIITKKARYWNFWFEISAWSSFQKELCEEKRLDHVEDQDSDEDRSWWSLMTMWNDGHESLASLHELNFAESKRWSCGVRKDEGQDKTQSRTWIVSTSSCPPDMAFWTTAHAKNSRSQDARIILPGDTVRIIRGLQAIIHWLPHSNKSFGLFATYLQGLQGRLGEVIKALSKGWNSGYELPPDVSGDLKMYDVRRISMTIEATRDLMVIQEYGKMRYWYSTPYCTPLKLLLQTLMSGAFQIRLRPPAVRPFCRFWCVFFSHHSILKVEVLPTSVDRYGAEPEIHARS